MQSLEYSQKAAKIHKQVRKDIKDIIKPGIKLWDICTNIEDRIRYYSKQDGNFLNDGIAFPTGCSLNHIAAHFTPSKNDNTILKLGNIVFR